jgi:uncharacterized SAM-binding protein YcdF (DUF218 family)
VFFLKKVVSSLLLPPTGPLLLVIFGLIVIERRPRLGRIASWIGVGTLILLSLPVVSGELIKLVADDSELDLRAATDAQAIVVLAGGMRQSAREYGSDTVNAFSLERARYAAFLSRRTGLPILVTGGVVQPGEPEAELVRRVLEEEFGVKVRWVEMTSRNTHENATHSAEILRRSGVTRILLVTHAFHMRRAQREFGALGIEVIPAPTRIPNSQHDLALEFVPSAAALNTSYFAAHELLGNLLLTLSGQ